MMERFGGLILLVGGGSLLAGGLLAADGGVTVGLCALGASLLVLAVVLNRTEGPLKVGPSGLETHLRREATVEARRVGDFLTENGLDSLLATASGDRSLEDVAQPEQIKRSLSSLVRALERLEVAQERDQDESVPPDVLLNAAHGLMAAEEWTKAANYFDRYVAVEPDNWEAQFSRAVAHANARSGKDSNLASLRAYNDALALRPPDAEPNLIARLFSYRGAILKRLGRLPEAEADLRIGDGLATEEYEKNDIRYNLACVFAMTNRRDEALSLVRTLEGTPFIEAIYANRHRYFEALADDPEFREMVG